MKKLAIGVCCGLLSVLAISELNSTFANKSTQPEPSQAARRSVQNNEKKMIPIDGTATASLGEDVVKESELIVTGRCTNVKSSWINERTLVTLATIEVDEVLKGAERSSVTVVLPGGIDVNRRVPIAVSHPGAPQISPDENVFLFLTPKGQVPNGFSVTKFAAGKFSILEGASGEKFVSGDRINRESRPNAQPQARTSGQSNDPAVAAATVAPDTVVKNAVPLETFKEQVQSLLQ